MKQIQIKNSVDELLKRGKFPGYFRHYESQINQNLPSLKSLNIDKNESNTTNSFNDGPHIFEKINKNADIKDKIVYLSDKLFHITEKVKILYKSFQVYYMIH